MSTPEEQVQQEGVDNGRPDWLPENFKTPEDLAKSYDESRREMDKLRSERDEERAQFAAALERIEAATTTQQQREPTGDPQANQLLSAYAQAVEAGDAAAMLSIQLALNQQATAQVIDERLGKLTPQLESQSKADRDIAFEIASERVAKQYGDQWPDVQPEVQKWLKEHQSWLPTTNSPEAFEQVIREGASIIVNAKAAEQLAAAQQDREAKLTAQTATGGASGKHPIVTDEKKAAWNEVVNADVGSYSQARSK